jgi:GT2 family glycosyltransferase
MYTEIETGKRSPSVVAVVLTWNDTRMTDACVASLLDNDHLPLHVIVVDNGSREPCGKQIQERYPCIELVALPENRGFTGGCNAGLRRALACGADYIFLLNNDTVVDRTAISRLVRELEDRTDAGAATPLILFPGKERNVQFYTSVIKRDRAMHYRYPMKPIPVASREWPTVETEFAPACALMFRTAALREVGIFDEGFGTNWEDYDLCLRFTDAGWRLLSIGQAEVVHVGGATTGVTSPYITYYHVRNRLVCLMRHSRPCGILIQSLAIMAGFLGLVRRYGFTNFPCHWAFLKGSWHFFLGIRTEGKPPQSRK